jgi:predicted ArsR family transcriptional regulator
MDAAIEIDTNLTQRIVEILSTMESAKSKDVADELGVDPNRVRQELIALEELGVVYRTGKTRGTRWWLG